MSTQSLGLTRLAAAEDAICALAAAAGAPPELVAAYGGAIAARDPVRIKQTATALIRSLPALRGRAPSI